MVAQPSGLPIVAVDNVRTKYWSVWNLHYNLTKLSINGVLHCDSTKISAETKTRERCTLCVRCICKKW